MKTFTWNRAQLYSKNFFSFVRSRLLGLQLGLFDFVDADTMPSEEKKRSHICEFSIIIKV